MSRPPKGTFFVFDPTDPTEVAEGIRVLMAFARKGPDTAERTCVRALDLTNQVAIDARQLSSDKRRRT